MDRGVTVKRLYEAINAGDMDIFDDVFAGDFVEHEELPGLEPSKEGVRAFFESFLTAFPISGWSRWKSSSVATRSSHA